MILISEEDYEALQNNGLDNFKSFVERMESDKMPDSSDFDMSRNFVFVICQFALIGQLKYSELYSIVSDIMTDIDRLKFFTKVHSKEEVYNYIASN